MVCGECIGEYRENCAQKHLQKYPNHHDFIVKRIADPLLLSSPDEWFERMKIKPTHHPKLNTEKNIDERPDDEQKLKSSSVSIWGLWF